jgi:hypothetical protein
MILKKNPNLLLRIGLAFLVLALAAQFFLRPVPAAWRDWADGLNGLLFGLAIGCLFLVSVMLGRQRNGTAG